MLSDNTYESPWTYRSGRHKQARDRSLYKGGEICTNVLYKALVIHDFIQEFGEYELA